MGFSSFILLAEMRTGSNLLEEYINQFPDLDCFGELFNPHFIGYPNKDDFFGVTMEQRVETPNLALDAAAENTRGIPGFRFFHDHDARVLQPLLMDKTRAKIILTRNPLDSYVSWKIASVTGQWRLTNPTCHKVEQIEFDPDEFEAHVEKLQQFQVYLLNTLQASGQVAFFVSYDDLQNLDVINGLGAFLGSQHRLENLSRKLKKQNPSPMDQKIANFDLAEAAMARMDRFNLSRTPNFEPRRGPSVPRFVAAEHAPLLFMPIQTGLDGVVKNWLARLDGAQPDDLHTRFSQKTLRQWRRRNKGSRSFTVVQHPVARAYHAFCKYILPVGKGAYPEIRKTLRRIHKIPLPDGPLDDQFTVDQMRDCFAGWLIFLKSNLSGQTSIRVDASWASQSHAVQGISEIAPPDLIVREDRLEQDFGYLSAAVGYAAQQVDVVSTDALYPVPLADVYDADIERLCKDAYGKDYLQFGFEKWIV